MAQRELSNQNCLMPAWSNPDVGNWSSGELREALEVGAGVLGELLPGLALRGVALPAGEGFVDGDDAVPGVAVGGGELVLLAVDLVVGADLDGVALVEAIEVGDGEPGDAIDHTGVAEEDHVEPTTGAGATSGCAELAAKAVQVVSEVVVVGGKGTCADPRGVGLADSDDGLDGEGRQSGASGAAAGSGVGGGHEGVGPEVDVEEGALCALEENHFLCFPGLVHDGDDVADVRAEAVESRGDGLDDAVDGEGLKAEGREDCVGIRNPQFEQFS